MSQSEREYARTGGLAPSVFGANLAELGRELRRVDEYAVRWHVDLMDGHFVPNLALSPAVVAAMRPLTGLPIHCHLMVDNPVVFMEALAEAGADIVTWHIEVSGDETQAIEARARELGLRSGLALKLDTNPQECFRYLEMLDTVVVMGIEPGWSGQEFTRSSLATIHALRREIDRQGLQTAIEVDGGITEVTGRECIEAGATILVAATAVFGSDDASACAERLAAIARGGSERTVY